MTRLFRFLSALHGHHFSQETHSCGHLCAAVSWLSPWLRGGDTTEFHGGRQDKMLSPGNASVNEMQADALRNLHWTRENMLYMTPLNLVGT